MDDRTFGELLALANLLPGASSSQLGMAIGAIRAGKLAAAVAWVGFTLPSALALGLFAYGVQELRPDADAGWLHGLELAAAAVVLHAVVGMARTLAPDPPRIVLAAAAAAVALAASGPPAQLVPILGGALAGALLLPRAAAESLPPLRLPIGRRGAAVALGVFVALLVGLPVVRDATGSHAAALADAFYRTGSLVFGGGHVVLPLLDAEVVQRGWVTEEEFVAGYGAAQAIPGPLFTFAAYLGVVSDGWWGGVLATVAIFLPSFLLLAGVAPLWSAVRAHPRVGAGAAGAAAAVVGLLAAALWDPVLATAIHGWGDVAAWLALALLLLRVPPWALVALAAVAGGLLA